MSINILIDGEKEGSAQYDFVCLDANGTKHHSRGAYYVKAVVESVFGGLRLKTDFAK